MAEDELELDVVAYVATERHEGTYDPGAAHPMGHVLSVNGQGHLPVACDCPREASGG